MLPLQEAQRILDTAELICPAVVVSEAVRRVAGEISDKLAGQYPLVLSVMGGAVVFAGHLLTELKFPLDFDYVHVTRYGNHTSGAELNWVAMPQEIISDRVILIVDDVLDEGITLAAIRQRMLDNGAKACYLAVLANKEIGRQKPVTADFVGISLPNRFVFGFGMDVHGAWRNLPAIYALPNK